MNEIFILFFRITITICIVSFIFIPFFVQNSLYHPSNRSFSVDLDYQDIFIQTEDGISINAWYSAPTMNNTTVIFCHGNGGNLTYYEELVKILQNEGYGVLAIDYRGYGKSEGKPHEEGLYKDLRAAVHYLKQEKNITEENIVLWGLSLGGAVVSQIASENGNFKGVILQSTFTNVEDMTSYVLHSSLLGIKSNYKSFFTHNLIKLIPVIQKFDTGAKVPLIKSPLLIAHAVPDNVVPVVMSKELGKLNSKAGLFISKEGSHNEYSWFYPKLTEFLSELEAVEATTVK